MKASEDERRRKKGESSSAKAAPSMVPNHLQKLQAKPLSEGPGGKVGVFFLLLLFSLLVVCFCDACVVCVFVSLVLYVCLCGASVAV